MIKDISALRDRSTEFLTRFVENCTVEEKIDAYYVSIEIHTHRLVFRKANNRKITRPDMILNAMYGTLVNVLRQAPQLQIFLHLIDQSHQLFFQHQ